MGEIHIKLEPDHMPKDTKELVDYLRTMICVDDRGMRRLPNYVDDQVCDAAADLIEKLLAERAPPQTNLRGIVTELSYVYVAHLEEHDRAAQVGGYVSLDDDFPVDVPLRLCRLAFEANAE